MFPKIKDNKYSASGNFPLVAIVFILPAIYWIYLALVSEMIIVHDSVSYQELGLLLYKNGWIEYFKQGPMREPLYPLLISISMKIADAFSLSPSLAQKIIQILFLSLTQILLFLTLKKIKVNNVITFFTLLYFGFSPAIVNSALSMYSEVACFPFLIGIILANIYSWDLLWSDNRPARIGLWGSLLGLLFILATSVKGVYEYLFLVFLIPYACLFLKSAVLKNKKLFVNTGLFLLIALLTFNAFIISYKLLNKKYNGNYVFVNKGRTVLYNSAAIRAEKLTKKRLLTAIAYIPGETFCNSIFGQEECSFWGTRNLESFQHTSEAKSLAAITPKDKRHSAIMASIKEKILGNPSRFILLMSIDGIKLFFWESTRIGFVAYPDWLARIYDYFPFKIGLRVLVSGLSLFAFFYLACLVFKNRGKLLGANSGENKFIPACLFTLLIIFSHVALYAFCAASVPRHALPLAPLYLLTVAVSIHRIRP